VQYGFIQWASQTREAVDGVRRSVQPTRRECIAANSSSIMDTFFLRLAEMKPTKTTYNIRNLEEQTKIVNSPPNF